MSETVYRVSVDHYEYNDDKFTKTFKKESSARNYMMKLTDKFIVELNEELDEGIFEEWCKYLIGGKEFYEKIEQDLFVTDIVHKNNVIIVIDDEPETTKNPMDCLVCVSIRMEEGYVVDKEESK